MSTVIYDGLRAVDTNLFVVREKINSVVQPIFFQEYDKLEKIVKTAGHRGETWCQALNLPRHRFVKWETSINPIMYKEYLYDLIQEVHVNPMRNFSPADIAYSVHLLPNGLGVGEKPLILLFSERLGNTMRKALIDAGVVEEYGYWDNVDAEDGVSESEWQDRKQAWNLLDIPASSGLNIEMPNKLETCWRK